MKNLSNSWNLFIAQKGLYNGKMFFRLLKYYLKKILRLFHWKAFQKSSMASLQKNFLETFIFKSVITTPSIMAPVPWRNTCYLQEHSHLGFFHGLDGCLYKFDGHLQVISVATDKRAHMAQFLVLLMADSLY